MTQLSNAESQKIHTLCALEELPIGLGRAFVIQGHTVAVFRTRKGEVFAMANSCPHKNGPLSEGMISRDADGTPLAVCPLHNFRFSARTGECDQAGICAIRTYPVILVDNVVQIELPA